MTATLKRIVCLSLSVVFGHGCHEASTTSIGNPWPEVRCLMEANRTHIERKVGLPSEDAWSRLSLEYFRAGGAYNVALSWSDSRLSSKPLLFDRTGRFLCYPVTYANLDVTGDGMRDLITVEFENPGVHYRVRDLAAEPHTCVDLAIVDRVSVGEDMHPRCYDFDKDGTFEIICRLPYGALRHGGSLVQECEALRPEERVIVVWSLYGGTARIVLALASVWAALPDPLMGGLAIGSDPDTVAYGGASVTWNAGASRFVIPRVPGARVLINRAILPPRHE